MSILSTYGTSERRISDQDGVLATCSFRSDDITIVDVGSIDPDVKGIIDDIILG